MDKAKKPRIVFIEFGEIIDEWGLEPLKAAQRNDMIEIMDDRHENTSTLMISQFSTDHWYQSISDNTLADAILDRLMHNAQRIKLKGESMRKKQAELTDREHFRGKITQTQWVDKGSVRHDKNMHQILFSIERACDLDQCLGEVGVNSPVSLFVGVCQCAPGCRR